MLPYLFADTQSAEKLFASDFMTRQLNQQIIAKYGVRSLGWLIGGFRHMTNAVRPVTQLKDLAGLRIRLPASRIMVATYENLGAEVLPMNWADVPAALQSGAIDGQENPYSVIAYSRPVLIDKLDHLSNVCQMLCTIATHLERLSLSGNRSIPEGGLFEAKEDQQTSRKLHSPLLDRK